MNTESTFSLKEFILQNNLTNSKIDENQCILNDDIEYPSFSISGIETKSLIIKKGVFKSLTINSGDFSYGISIEGGTFEYLQFTGLLHIGESSNKWRTRNPIIKGGTFHNFSIEDCFLTQDFEINGGTFENGIHLTGHVNLQSTFAITGGIFKKSINISRVRLRSTRVSPSAVVIFNFELYHDCRINIEGNDVIKIIIGKFSIHQLSQYISIENISIFQLNFSSFDSQSSNIFSIKNCNISSISLSHFNNHGKITFNHISPIEQNVFNNIKFGNFSRSSGNNSEPIEQKFSNMLSPSKSITISHSNVGNLDFISCKLENYKLFINSSKLLNIFYTNTTFPEKIEVSSLKNLSKDEILFKLKDIYEQLQTVSSKQGDKNNSIHWQAKSQECYEKTLSYKNLDWWMLKANKLSNNYRRNWLQGVFFTIISALVFYIPLVLCSDGNLNICVTPSQCNTLESLSYFFKTHFSNFFEFLNPAHKVDFLKIEVQDNFKPLSGFFDFFGRLFIGFGIYQTIQAFRKLGKGGD